MSERTESELGLLPEEDVSEMRERLSQAEADLDLALDVLGKLRGLIRGSRIEQRIVSKTGARGTVQADAGVDPDREPSGSRVVAFYLIDSRKVEAILGAPA